MCMLGVGVGGKGRRVEREVGGGGGWAKRGGWGGGYQMFFTMFFYHNQGCLLDNLLNSPSMLKWQSVVL